MAVAQQMDLTGGKLEMLKHIKQRVSVLGTTSAAVVLLFVLFFPTMQDR